MTKICFRRSFNSFSRRFQLHRISTSVTEEFRESYFIFYYHTYIKSEKRDRIFQWRNEKEWTTPYDQDGTFLSRWKIGTLFFLLISSHLYRLKFNVIIFCNLSPSNKKHVFQTKRNNYFVQKVNWTFSDDENSGNSVSGQFPPRKIAPRLGLWFMSRSELVLGLGDNQTIAPEENCPPVLGLRFDLWIVLGLERNFPRGQLS